MRRVSINRRTLSIILCIVLIFTFSLSLAYAALSITLNIQGNAEVVASTWDVYLDNVNVKYGSVSSNLPSIVGPTTVKFSSSLTTPGEFYEFTVDVVNAGSIDAMISNVVKTPTLTEEQSKYLNYIIEYDNGEPINNKQLLKRNSFVRLRVRVEFRKDITAADLPSSELILNSSFQVIYSQSDSNATEVINDGVKKTIKFTIDGVEFESEENMTWGEWVDSEYNTNDAFADEYGDIYVGDYIYVGKYHGYWPHIHIAESKYNGVRLSDLIVANNEYCYWDEEEEWLENSYFLIDGKKMVYRVYPDSHVFIEQFKNSWPYYVYENESEYNSFYDYMDFISYYGSYDTIDDIDLNADIVVLPGDGQYYYLCYEDGKHVKYGDEIFELGAYFLVKL